MWPSAPIVASRVPQSQCCFSQPTIICPLGRKPSALRCNTEAANVDCDQLVGGGSWVAGLQTLAGSRLLGQAGPGASAHHCLVEVCQGELCDECRFHVGDFEKPAGIQRGSSGATVGGLPAAAAAAAAVSAAAPAWRPYSLKLSSEGPCPHSLYT